MSSPIIIAILLSFLVPHGCKSNVTSDTEGRMKEEKERRVPVVSDLFRNAKVSPEKSLYVSTYVFPEVCHLAILNCKGCRESEYLAGYIDSPSRIWVSQEGNGNRYRVDKEQCLPQVFRVGFDIFTFN